MKLAAAVLAVLLLLSGCCNPASYKKEAEKCLKKGGTFCYKCDFWTPFQATVTTSCSK